MKRESEFTCYKDSDTFALSRLHLTVFICSVYAMLLLPILFSAASSYAEGPKVFTDADLKNYKAEPMVDQDTVSRIENDLKSYEKKSDAEFLLDREKKQRQQAEEVKRAALQKQKQDTAVSRAAVSNQSSGSGYISSPGSKRRT